MSYTCIGKNGFIFKTPGCGEVWQMDYDKCPICRGYLIPTSMVGPQHKFFIKKENKMDNQLEFTKEEKEIIHLQLMPRKEAFKQLALDAAKKDDFNRMKECSNYMDKIQVIMDKCLNNKVVESKKLNTPNSSSGVDRNI